MQNVNLFEVRHVSVSINRPPELVYEFAATPENLPSGRPGWGPPFTDEVTATGSLTAVRWAARRSPR
jgi:hypothetical protein